MTKELEETKRKTLLEMFKEIESLEVSDSPLMTVEDCLPFMCEKVEQALLESQEQGLTESVEGRSFNKEILYLKQSIEQYNDKPIYYMSRSFGNKYIVPQELFEKQEQELKKYKKAWEVVVKKDVIVGKLKQCSSYEEYNNFIIEFLGFSLSKGKLLTEEEFDLLKETKNYYEKTK